MESITQLFESNYFVVDVSVLEILLLMAKMAAMIIMRRSENSCLVLVLNFWKKNWKKEAMSI